MQKGTCGVRVSQPNPDRRIQYIEMMSLEAQRTLEYESAAIHRSSRGRNQVVRRAAHAAPCTGVFAARYAGAMVERP